jgi:hypothetical protein
MSAQPGAPQPGMQSNNEADRHEQEIENKEAFEYWGYLFKQDKTGTDKLKSLLKGLKDLMVWDYYALGCACCG